MPKYIRGAGFLACRACPAPGAPLIDPFRWIPTESLYAIGFFTMMLVGAVGYQLRLKHLKRLNEELEVRITERTTEVVRQKNEVALANRELNHLVVQLEESQRRIELASRARGEFLANVSHEIRTPMNAILGMTELALDTDLTHEQQRYLNTVRTAANSLLLIINDVLDFSKIEAGKLELNPVAFRLRDSLGGMLKTLALRAHEKRRELACHVVDSVPDFLVGDVVRLRQVMLNLVGNAIKFTNGGEIIVRVATEWRSAGEACLHFSVTDTGMGIPAEKQALIFEAFAQADGSTTRRYGGTGLGLAIASQLVALMNGRIWVESEVGRGSVFHFTARFRRQLRPSERPALTPPSGLRGLRVLVADDNSSGREIVMDMLRAWHLRPAGAAGGTEALDLLAQAADDGDAYRLVFADAEMPGMNGFDLVRVIRERHVGAKVILMIASADELRDASRCRDLDTPYITKPVTHSQVMDTIVTALGLSAAEDRGDMPAPRNGRAEAAVPLTILIAEDNVINQELVTSILRKRGHRVTVVSNAQAAIEALDRESFDIVLMDCQMPEMDGFQATATIRAHEAATGGHVRIVAMTASAMEGDRERCLEAGMDDYVAKPIHTPELLKVVEARPAQESAAAPLPPVDSLVDRDALLERVDGDLDLLKRMVEPFVSDCARVVGTIRVAVGRQDCRTLERSAHFLKGSVGNFCAPALFDLALRLERLAKAGDLTEAPPLLDPLEDGVDQLKRELTALVQGALVPDPPAADKRDNAASRADGSPVGATLPAN